MLLLNKTKFERIRGPVVFFLVAIVWSCTAIAQSLQDQFFAKESYGLSSEYLSLNFRSENGSLINNFEGQDEDWDEEGSGRSFLFKEAVFSGAYFFHGVTGIPPGDTTRDHFEISPRPPGSYIGLDFVRTFTSSSFMNKALPDWLPLKAMDLHPRLVYDRMEENTGLDRVKFAPQDFWLRFNPGGVDRLMLRVGQFVIPYGVNPILAPRQRFMLPVEAIDLGLKWDWGLDLMGPVGEYDWEIGASIGSGEALHSPHLFSGSDRTSYLITGRIGSPTYWDFQQGLSFLYGDLPVIMGPRVLNDVAISRWRIAYNLFYKYGDYLMTGAQSTYGQNGFAGDEEFVALTGGKTADVLSYRAWADWIIPVHQNARLAAQLESVIRDLSTSGSDDTAIIFQVSYSLTTTITTNLHFREELNRSMGEKNDGIYFTFIFYSS
jgi:hypothetical protein